MKMTNFIGIDVSKGTLDICLVQDNKVLTQFQIPNRLDAIKQAFARLRKQFLVKATNTCCCMEHTGIYNFILLEYLWSKKYAIWLERAIQIKQSSGAVRGKSDAIDAVRIAIYAYKHQLDFLPWKPEREVIQTLKALLTTRTRLINVRKQLSVPLKEAEGFMDKKTIKLNEKLNEKPIKAVQTALLKTEQEITTLINSDDQLRSLFSLVESVDGVGRIVAANLIARTNEFKTYTDAKKFACYAGVAPFPHSSGSSIRGRTRVSHMANKSVKTLMHLAAMAAVTTKGELGQYYRRKLLEGKNKMSIINAVRNKLIARIFAVVKRNEPYQKNYQYSFA